MKFCIRTILLLGVLMNSPNFATELKNGFMKIGNDKIYYEESGEGDVVILVHGGDCDRRMWDEQFNYLSMSYRVIRYDARGFGKSDKPSEEYSAYDDLSFLIDSLNLKDVILIGQSLGASTIAEYYIQYPQKVKKMILSSPGFQNWTYKKSDLDKLIEFSKIIQTEGSLAAVEKMFSNEEFWKPTVPSKEYVSVRDYFRTIVTENKDMFTTNWSLKKILEPSSLERLNEINVPCLIIYADQDIGYVEDISIYLSKNIENSRIVKITNGGHMINMEQPEKYNKVIGEFIK